MRRPPLGAACCVWPPGGAQLQVSLLSVLVQVKLASSP